MINKLKHSSLIIINQKTEGGEGRGNMQKPGVMRQDPTVHISNQF